MGVYNVRNNCYILYMIGNGGAQGKTYSITCTCTCIQCMYNEYYIYYIYVYIYTYIYYIYIHSIYIYYIYGVYMYFGVLDRLIQIKYETLKLLQNRPKYPVL